MGHTVRDVLAALSMVSRDRVIVDSRSLLFNHNDCVVTKTSHIPGKAITELPGLVYGELDDHVRAMGLAMSMTENFIELAGAMSINVLIIHHPVADAASSGGVPIRDYLALYGISLFELHEAFHGTHPGVAYLHGFAATTIYTGYQGVPGVNVYIGRTLPGIHTLGDMCSRVGRFMGVAQEEEMLAAERQVRGVPDLEETLVRTKVEILVGSADSPVTEVLQFAPHSGFNPAMLDHVLKEHSGIDTIVAAKGRLSPTHPLVKKASQLRLNVLNGNSHGYEIYENWMPLAAALETALPGVPVYIMRERVTASLSSQCGTPDIRAYAREMADKHLLKKRTRS